MIRKIFMDLYRYRYTYLLRGILLQLFLTTFGVYVLSELFSLILATANQVQLTKDNIWQFLGHPLTLGALFLYLLSLAFLIYLEFALLVSIIRQKEEPLGVSKKRFKSDFKNFWHSISGWNQLAFVGYLLLTLPMVQLVVSSVLVEDLYVPKFIIGELMKSSPTKYIVMGVGAILAYINLRLIYTLPLMVSRSGKFIDHLKESWQLTKKGLLKLIFEIAGIELLVSLAAGVPTVLVLAILSLSNEKNWLLNVIFMSFVWGLLFAVSLLSKLGILSVLVADIDGAPKQSTRNKRLARKHAILLTLMILVLGTGNVLLNIQRFQGKAYNDKIDIIGHRGYVSQGVENSLEALEAAAKQGVDYVELDIILTKDNQFVVMHDNDLNRLAGIDKKVREMTADEVVGLPIKQGKYTSNIPSFEEFVKKAKELNVKLLVELKPYGGEPKDYTKLFIEKMRELGVDKTYKTMSLDLAVMEKIEKEAPEIETGYVIPLQLGDFADNKVDFWVIEDFSYRERLALEAKQKNKELYVWTVNEEEQIEKYLQSSTNGIITDYPNLVRKIQKELLQNDSYFSRFIQMLDPIK